MLHGDVVDQLLDQDRLADPRAAEQAGLAPLQVRLEQIDDLDPGLEHLQLRALLFEGRRFAMDRQHRLGVDGTHLVHRFPEYIDHPSESFLADGNHDRGARIDRLHAAHHPVGRLHGHAAHPPLAEVLLHLGGHVDGDRRLGPFAGDPHGGIDLGNVLVRELNVHDGTDDLHDLSDVHPRSLLTGCGRRSGRPSPAP